MANDTLSHLNRLSAQGALPLDLQLLFDIMNEMRALHAELKAIKASVNEIHNQVMSSKVEEEDESEGK